LGGTNKEVGKIRVSEIPFEAIAYFPLGNVSSVKCACAQTKFDFALLEIVLVTYTYLDVITGVEKMLVFLAPTVQ
jgi:hypothetical protein